VGRPRRRFAAFAGAHTGLGRRYREIDASDSPYATAPDAWADIADIIGEIGRQGEG
jgi:hypothetical protein